MLHLNWAFRVVTPWCLGAGLLASITAKAGQDATIGASLSPLRFRAAAAPGNLVPDELAETNSAGQAPEPPGILLAPGLRQASLTLGEVKDFTRIPDEIEPRRTLKHPGQNFPEIDRSRKGDPRVGLRPTFDTGYRARGGLERSRAAMLLFEQDAARPGGGFTAWDGGQDDIEADAHFEPWPEGKSPAAAASATGSSPRQRGSTPTVPQPLTRNLAQTMRPAELNERLAQGATPAAPRAIALSSVTPAASDTAPVEVAALSPKAGRQAQTNPQHSLVPRPDYTAFAGGDRAAGEQRCLAEAIYFEARSEPEEGQAAVAQVVLNRVASGLYPSSICGAVYQNRQHFNACQFSFACDGKSLRVTQPGAWQTAMRIAGEVTQGKTYVADVGGATHYHANYARPAWARSLKKMDVIGRHIFYQLRPGQT